MLLDKCDTIQIQYDTIKLHYRIIILWNWQCFKSSRAFSLLQSMQSADSAISRHTGMKHTHLESGFSSRKWATMHLRAFVLSWWPLRGPRGWTYLESRKTDGGLWRWTRWEWDATLASNQPYSIFYSFSRRNVHSPEITLSFLQKCAKIYLQRSSISKCFPGREGREKGAEEEI